MRYLHIVHHGAQHGVTGSCPQTYMGAEHSLLVHCGPSQGDETSVDGRCGEGQHNVKFCLATIKELILTDVRTDHVGRVPCLLASAERCPSLWRAQVLVAQLRMQHER
ncbi:MAG: hypothetical protein FH750_12680 [Pseudomonas stutzeri]|nr:hypothetical protein [Stutzerimonas stutzeri]